MVDPDDRAVIGGMTEDQVRDRYVELLDLDAAETSPCMAHLWDWYCGELNTELWNWAVTLAATRRLAICSNSGDGARREEERRYGSSTRSCTRTKRVTPNPTRASSRCWCRQVGCAPDRLVFIDDSAAIVEAAAAFGIAGVHHVDDASTIAEVERQLRELDWADEDDGAPGAR